MCESFSFAGNNAKSHCTPRNVLNWANSSRIFILNCRKMFEKWNTLPG